MRRSSLIVLVVLLQQRHSLHSGTRRRIMQVIKLAHRRPRRRRPDGPGLLTACCLRHGTNKEAGEGRLSSDRRTG